MKASPMGGIIIVVSLLMVYLSKTSKKQPVLNKDGTMILKLDNVYGLVGYTGVIISGVIPITDLLGIVESQEDVLQIIGISVLSLILSIPLILLARNYKVEVTEDIIRYYSITGKTREIMWIDINKVKFGKISLELSLYTDYYKIKLHAHLIGFPSFIEIMKQKLKPSLYEDALKEMGQLSNKY